MSLPSPQRALTRHATRVPELSGRCLRLLAANARLAQARDEAVEAHRAKSAFLAGLSHQLRTPLNTILLCSELLSDDLKSQGLGPLTEDLDRIQGAGRHLLALLDDVLDLTRLEAGRMVFKREETDLAALVDQLAASFQPLASSNGNTLEVRRPDGLEPLSIDPGKLEQILAHFVNNALKFTRSGSVTLDLSCAEDGRELRFAVRDTGIGMSLEQLERIRADFAQAPGQGGRSYGNAGLGLTLCRVLAQGLGGRLQVERSQGGGSTFTLVLVRE